MRQTITSTVVATTALRLAEKVIVVLILLNPLITYAQMPGQPPNSYVVGANWYCKEGFQKSGESCVSIFSTMPGGQPPNSYVVGANWYCKKGFQKSGESCVSIFSTMPPPRQSRELQVESESLASKNGIERQKQNEQVERQIAQQQKESESERDRLGELQRKMAKQKNAGKVKGDAAYRKAAVKKEAKKPSVPDTATQPGSPISGGLPPIKSKN